LNHRDAEGTEKDFVSGEHPRAYLYTLLVIVLLSAALRVAFLSQPMRFDEAFSYLRFASRPLSEGLTNYSEPNNHLFHTLLVHITTSIFGDQPWAIRLPAFFAGIVLVPLVYTVTRLHYNAEAGLLAAVLTGSSSVLVEFSTNARGYTLVCCCFVALLGLGIILRHCAHVERWLLFAVLAAAGIYTVPTMLYPLGVVAVWLLLSILVEHRGQTRRNLLVSWLLALLLAAGLTTLLYLPTITISGLDSLIGNRYVQPLMWESFTLQIPVLWRQMWLTWNRDIPALLQWILIIGFATSLVFHRRMARHPVPVVLAGALWLIPVLLIQRVVGFPRTWLFLLPLYFIAASGGIFFLIQAFHQRMQALQQGHVAERTRRPAPTVYAIAVVLLSGLLGFLVLQSQSILASEETGALVGAEMFASVLKDRLQPGDGIMALRPADAPLEYYFRLNGMSAGSINTDLASKTRLFVVVYEPASTLAEMLARVGLSANDYGAPELVARVESASLYLIESH